MIPKTSFFHAFNKQDLNSFVRISQDSNSIHCDRDYAVSLGFSSNLVHGILVSSLYSRLIGMYLPGGNVVIAKAEILFRNPCYCDQLLECSGQQVEYHEALRLHTIASEIRAVSCQTVISSATLLVKDVA